MHTVVIAKSGSGKSILPLDMILEHLLPQEPQSIEQIADSLSSLINPWQISCEIESPFCCCDAPPVLLMIDCPICSKPYKK